jgi:hypothetical protein
MQPFSEKMARAISPKLDITRAIKLKKALILRPATEAAHGTPAL